jgi:carbamoyl-phosphate synthase large subunit
MIKNGEIALIINTVDERRASIQDSYSIRFEALKGRVPIYTTVAGGRAAAYGIKHMKEWTVYSVQDLHQRLQTA